MTRVGVFSLAKAFSCFTSSFDQGSPWLRVDLVSPGGLAGFGGGRLSAGLNLRFAMFASSERYPARNAGGVGRFLFRPRLLPHDRPRRLVRPQPLEAGLPHLPVSGPARKLDLGDELWLDPADACAAGDARPWWEW